MATRNPDALAILLADHKRIKDLFTRFQKAGDRAHKQKRTLVDRMIHELGEHAAIEEEVFYPALRDRDSGLEDDVLEGLEEHHVAKLVLAELERLDPAHERFDAKVTVLIESTLHHIEEEEKDIFPKVRKAFERSELVEMGELLQEARRHAPTRPHPHAPDVPPFNLVTNPATRPLDKAVETGRQAVGIAVAVGGTLVGEAVRRVKGSRR